MLFCRLAVYGNRGLKSQFLKPNRSLSSRNSHVVLSRIEFDSQSAQLNAGGMVTINIEYTGELRCNAVHEPSGTTLITDAPVDNKGKGESFSPTDLVATALGSCIVTTMGIKGLDKGWDLKGTTVRVDKIMSADTPRRISKLVVELNIPDRFDEQEKKHLKNIARACPVHHTISSDTEIDVIFNWV